MKKSNKNTSATKQPDIVNFSKLTADQAQSLSRILYFVPLLIEKISISAKGVITLSGNLICRSKRITKLPEKLVVNGCLDVRSCDELENLPGDLIVNGALFLGSVLNDPFPSTIVVKGSLHIWSASCIPDNFTLGGDLILEYKHAQLPSGLTVMGSLDLSNDNGKKDNKEFPLPENLTVYGTLSCEYREILRIPESLKVYGDVDFSHTDISELPDSLIFFGSVSFRGTSISVLPKKMKTINGDLDISETNIRSFQDGLHVKGDFWMEDCPIKNLPTKLKIDGSLYAEDSEVREFPVGPSIGGSLDLIGTNVSVLPSGLKISHGIYLSRCPIKVLPSGLSAKNIDISRTPITHIPADTVIEFLEADNSNLKEVPKIKTLKQISVCGCKEITELPDGLCLDLLDIENTGVKKLPTNLKVLNSLNVRGTNVGFFDIEEESLANLSGEILINHAQSSTTYYPSIVGEKRKITSIGFNNAANTTFYIIAAVNPPTK